ncbi:MAG: metal-binding protein [Piscirickettsiaceae bacterium]|nr:MAG: metal-binding protein [Piscirickettsiaceae bacterium]
MDFHTIKKYLLITMLLSVVACEDINDQSKASNDGQKTTKQVQLDVYKSPTCDCCRKWVNYVDDNGFSSTIHHPKNLQHLKLDRGIAPKYQSCHTGISKDGYIFEGHVPVDAMKRFLKEKPADAIGLSVPGMPAGSPGMEMGSRRDDYDVLLLMKDGTARVYQEIRQAL